MISLVCARVDVNQSGEEEVRDARVNDQSQKVSELLPMALARPREALARARAVVAAGADPLAESVARHAVGIVLRDLGELEAAQAELRIAVRMARRANSPEREADSRATLGTVLVRAGRTRAGLAAIDAAARMSDGLLLGMVLMRRGGMLYELGRHTEALTELRRALAIVRQAHDPMWEDQDLARPGAPGDRCHRTRGRAVRGRRAALRGDRSGAGGRAVRAKPSAGRVPLG